MEEEKPIRPGFAMFWRIVAAEGPWNRVDISEFAWMDLLQEIQASPDAAWLREEFLMLLRPYLHLTQSFWRGSGGEAESIGDSIGTVANATVRLVGQDHLQNVVAAIDHLPDPDGFLARLPTHLTDLLEKGFDLCALAGQVTEDWDASVFERPSIQPHSQNRGFREWTVLFDLLWRSWQRIDQISPTQSRALVYHWQALPYSAFRRLALAAVTVSRNFTSAEKAGVLLDG
jgi:hypothetical protein